MLHEGLAAWSKCPELKMDDDDAELIGNKAGALLSFSNVKLTPKQKAAEQFGLALMRVYPPMISQIIMRKKEDAAAKGPQQRANNLTQLRPVATAPQPPAQVKPISGGLAPGFDPLNIKLDQ